MRHRAQRQKAHRGASAYGGRMKTGEGPLRREKGHARMGVRFVALIDAGNDVC
jgi:hypothetical protein